MSRNYTSNNTLLTYCNCYFASVTVKHAKYEQLSYSRRRHHRRHRRGAAIAAVVTAAR